MFLDDGLYVGQVARVRIRLHWFLLIWWAFDLHQLLSVESLARSAALGFWALGIGATFGSILLHELGHCFGARRVGGIANDVLLWPLGGLAYCTVPQTWRAQLVVAAAGPAVTLGILAVAWGGFELALGAHPELMDSAWAWLLRSYLVHFNFAILIFNLIPLYPLDGGRIFLALAWGLLSRPRAYHLGAYAAARRWTLRASYATAACGVVYAIGQQRIWLIAIFAWALLGLEALRRGEA